MVGVDIQAFSAVTSVIKVVHVVPSHLPASTVGKDVLPLYVPESTQYEHQWILIIFVQSSTGCSCWICRAVFNGFTSLVSVVQVVPSIFPDSRPGREVSAPYVQV